MRPTRQDDNFKTGAELNSNLRRLYKTRVLPNLHLSKSVQLEPSNLNEDLIIREFIEAYNLVTGSESRYPEFLSTTYFMTHDIIQHSATSLPFLHTKHLFANLREDSSATQKVPLGF